uniref:Uncharacterized protein n=1 Tax=Panagrolaimus davidi TaxID=227884 RepID=A0A914Q465_9BILA
MNVFDLYDSDDFNNFVDTLEGLTINETFAGSSVYKITSKSGCFTIYCAEKDILVLGTVLFRMQKENNNVDSFLVLNNLQTSTYGNFSFSSGLNGNPYFDVPFYELDLWKQVILYTPILSIVASPSSSLTFKISDDPLTDPKDSGKEKGVLVSPYYSGVNYSFIVGYGLHLKNTESANFIVKNISCDANVVLQNKLTNENHTFFANENYFTNGSEFYLYGNDVFRIEYTFDILPQDPTTTKAVIQTTSSIPPSTTTTLIQTTSSTTTPPSTTTTTLETTSVTPLSSSTRTPHKRTTPPKVQTTTTATTTFPPSRLTTHKNSGFISSYNIGTLLFALCFIPCL